MSHNIVPISPFLPAVAEIFQAAHAHLAQLYPEDCPPASPIDSFAQENALLLGAWVDQNLVATAAALRYPGDAQQVAYAEIKRVFVLDAWRGRGLARDLMLALEADLQKHGVLEARLQTGNRQGAALTLYSGLGYQVCAPFAGAYVDAFSVFMSKKL